VVDIFGNDTLSIQKRLLGKLERDAVLDPVGNVLCDIPLKIRHREQPSGICR